MADVIVTYKDASIIELSDSNTKIIRTAGKFCEDDINIQYIKPENNDLTDEEWVARFEPYKIQQPEDGTPIKTIIPNAAVAFTDSPTAGFILRFYLQAAKDSLANYKIFINGIERDQEANPIPYVSKAYYQFDFGHLKATQFDQFQTIEIKNQNDETEGIYKACLFSYAYNALAKSTNEKMKKWVKSWYAFCIDAHAYFD